MNDASGGALSLPRSNARVLDLCMAPGGYTAAVFKHSPHAIVCAYTLPQHLGGHRILHPRAPRLEVEFGDITMLYTEFGVEEIAHDHCEWSKFSGKRPWFGERFDLIFCDGQKLRPHERHIADYRHQSEAVRLTVSQLILALQRIESGGTFIMLLHNLARYHTIKIIHLFDNIAQLQLFKPASSHQKRGSFYLIAKDVQPGHSEAVAAVNEWKTVWKELTFPKFDQDGQAKSPKVFNETELAGEVSDLLTRFGERIIELGEPLWKIQKEALTTANWTRNNYKKSGKEGIRTGEASTAATDNAAVDLHGSDEDADDMPDDDYVDAVEVLGEDSKSIANDPAEIAEVDVKMERMGLDG